MTEDVFYIISYFKITRCDVPQFEAAEWIDFWQSKLKRESLEDFLHVSGRSSEIFYWKQCE